jgi:hypothetical protein
MPNTFRIGQEVDCTQSALHERWIVEKIEPNRGKDGEARLTVRSLDPDYSKSDPTKQNPVMVTASAC